MNVSNANPKILSTHVSHRKLHREGYCRICYNVIPANVDKVFVFTGSGYKTNIICPSCVEDMNDIRIRDESTY